MAPGNSQFSVQRVFGALVAFAFLSTVLFVLAVPRSGGGEEAKYHACISNLQRLGTSQYIYAQDFDQYLPPHFTFDGDAAREALASSLLPYGGGEGSLRCSEASRNGPDVTYEHFRTLAKLRDEDGLIKLSINQEAESKPWMHDEFAGSLQTEEGLEVETRHNDPNHRLAVLFLDGHVDTPITPLYPLNEFMRLE